jgi:hypothetical protein
MTNANPLDRRGFLKLLGFTGAGCKLDGALGWLQNVTWSEESMALHVWERLMTKHHDCPNGLAFFMRGERDADCFNFEIANVALTKERVIEDVKRIESASDFSYWITALDPSAKDSRIMKVSSFFNSPAHEFDRLCRDENLNVEFAEDDSRHISFVLDDIKYKVPVRGDTLQERLAHVPDTVKLFKSWRTEKFTPILSEADLRGPAKYA